MKRIASPYRAILVSVALIVTLAPQACPEEQLCLAHSKGRVAIRLPLDGGLGICSSPDGGYGIRWPGLQGAEFLGAGGIYLRFRLPGESGFRFVEPGRLEPLFVAAEGLIEGCAGG